MEAEQRFEPKMSYNGQQKRTGLRDVFDILVKAPQQRLQSLTFQLSESPEANIIHALCLIILRREAQAVTKLQMLSDSLLAKHLADKWQMSGGELEAFADHCGDFQESTRDSLTTLARIFRILSEQRLCNPRLANLAYESALSTGDQKGSSCDHLAYDPLREEAKRFAEWTSVPKDLKSMSCSDLYCSLDDGTLKVMPSRDQTERAHSLPSPLKESTSMPSYPSHLEISVPPTALFQQETSDRSKLNTPITSLSEVPANNAPGQSCTSEDLHLKSKEPSKSIKELSEMDDMSSVESVKVSSLISPTQSAQPTAQPNFALPTATNFVLPQTCVKTEDKGADKEEEEEEEEEEEDMFYAFVILHAPEDAEMAESIKERMESATDSNGATFSEEFAIPGRTALSSVQDAIDNTAFTMLLLTSNFTRMQELVTDSALINSINKKHKYNTVIPLLPRDNCMLRENMPCVLQTINPLEEKKSNFERKLKVVLSPATIKRQKKIWTEQQMVKKQKKRQERLMQLKQHQKQFIKECGAAQLLEEDSLKLLMAQKLLLRPNMLSGQEAAEGRVLWPHPSINITNAKYIMIGNDSQMTVDLGAGADKDSSVHDEEEQ